MVCRTVQTHPCGLPNCSDPSLWSAELFRPIPVVCRTVQTHPCGLPNCSDPSLWSAELFRPIPVVCRTVQTHPCGLPNCSDPSLWSAELFRPILVDFIHRVVRHTQYSSYSVVNLSSAELPGSSGCCAVEEPNRMTRNDD